MLWCQMRRQDHQNLPPLLQTQPAYKTASRTRPTPSKTKMTPNKITKILVDIDAIFFHRCGSGNKWRRQKGHQAAASFPGSSLWQCGQFISMKRTTVRIRRHQPVRRPKQSRHQRSEQREAHPDFPKTGGEPEAGGNRAERREQIRHQEFMRQQAEDAGQKCQHKKEWQCGAIERIDERTGRFLNGMNECFHTSTMRLTR